MKYIWRYLFVLSLLLFWIPLADAQTSGDFNIGFGTAHVKSNGAGIDNTSFTSCTPGTDSFCQSTPGLNGFLLGFGGDVMLSKLFGVGGEISFQPSRGNYGPLQFRQMFYDFNGIFAPVNKKRVALKLMGGIGGAKTGFTYHATSCVGTAICTSSDQSVGSANHFQLHAGAGVEIYLTEHLFIRPQFDLRYIPNFTDQFGSNVVPGGMFWIGFRTGGR
jgi:Outer membrane protein beta-barrel domain